MIQFIGLQPAPTWAGWSLLVEHKRMRESVNEWIITTDLFCVPCMEVAGEVCDGQISAFEYKWKAGKVARLPLPFSEAYPDATFQTITPDNYQEFV